MIAQEMHDEFETLNGDIEELIEKANFFGNEDIVMQMKKIVPEFISMNSTFQLLDK
jgi:hypothetical protein